MDSAFKLLCALVLLGFLGCSKGQETASTYPNTIGDIVYDGTMDDPLFKACDPDKIIQYYHLGMGIPYKGEKAAIKFYFKENFDPIDVPDENGYITIRFIVNCQGKTGRFRTTEMDLEYNKKSFPSSISNQIKELTYGLNEWLPGERGEKMYDYYQHLIFKIRNGDIVEIMP